MQGGWHDLDFWRERQRDLLGEVEAQRLARTRRPGWKAEGYVIREVDLGTGDHILYLATEEPEWAAWIWEQKTHG